MADADMLLLWRNDPETRQASRCPAVVPRDEHLSWLSHTLADPDRRLFVAEEDGTGVGTVRIERHADEFELSWTVAPEARGRGIGTRMVALLAGQVPGPIRAEIRAGHVPSIRIAEAAGMQPAGAHGDFLRYRRPALPVRPPAT